MKQVVFAGVRIALIPEAGLPEMALPRGFRIQEDNGPADIIITLREGGRPLPHPEGEPRLRRGRLAAYGNPDHMLWHHPDLGTIIELFPREGRVVIALPASAWSRTVDLFDQLLLPALLPPLAARGVRAIHASAVDFDGRCMMIAGPSGAGKTTTALLLIMQGGRLVSDDLLFIFRDGKGLHVAGLGDGIRAHDDVWARFGQLQPGLADLSGKRRLSGDALPTVAVSQPASCTLLGFPNLRGLLDDMKALPALLTVTYAAGDEPQALSMLRGLIETVPVRGARDAQAAAGIAWDSVRDAGETSG